MDKNIEIKPIKKFWLYRLKETLKSAVNLFYDQFVYYNPNTITPLCCLRHATRSIAQWTMISSLEHKVYTILGSHTVRYIM